LIYYASGTLSQTQRTQKMVIKLLFSSYLRGAILSTPAHVDLPESPFYYAGDGKTF
jgi:hypothetical protein